MMFRRGRPALELSPTLGHAAPHSRLLRLCRHNAKLILLLLLALCGAYTLLSPARPARLTPRPVAPNRLQRTATPASPTVASEAGQRSCPNPFRSRPFFVDGQADLSQCDSLPVSSSELAAYICPTPSDLPCNSFAIVIERVAEKAACSTEPFSKSAEYRRAIPTEYGPDSFTVIVTGTERFAVSRAIVSSRRLPALTA
jgi:hypothetical protein